MKKLFVSIVLGILFSVYSFALDFTFGAKLGCQFDGGTTISPAIAADMKALNARNISKNNNTKPINNGLQQKSDNNNKVQSSNVKQKEQLEKLNNIYNNMMKSISELKELSTNIIKNQ